MVSINGNGIEPPNSTLSSATSAAALVVDHYAAQLFTDAQISERQFRRTADMLFVAANHTVWTDEHSQVTGFSKSQFEARWMATLRRRNEYVRLLSVFISRKLDITDAMVYDLLQHWGAPNNEGIMNMLQDLFQHHYEDICEPFDPRPSRVDRCSDVYEDINIEYFMYVVYNHKSVADLWDASLEEHLWCPIMGRHQHAENMDVLKIVDFDFDGGHDIANDLFGPVEAGESRYLNSVFVVDGSADPHTWDVANGLVMNAELAQLVREDRAAVVARIDDSNSAAGGSFGDASSITTSLQVFQHERRFAYYFVILDQDLLTSEDRPDWVDELHNRRLSFRTEARPNIRYLQFRLLVASLRLGRRPAYKPLERVALADLQASKWALWYHLPDEGTASASTTIPGLKTTDTLVSADTGVPVRRAMLLYIAAAIGCMSIGEAQSFWGFPESGPTGTYSVPLSVDLFKQSILDALLVASHYNDLEREAFGDDAPAQTIIYGDDDDAEV
ncbi:hypothetical protein SPBR_05864 [Sporothrix brasiliensis 5110]|uniref:Uncharacterized protein n=1 Tax=Sporothrix brasiliensis 5110 TaxID=1398154 RepID=A0A0C2FS27_9PEZI|nr:uncharacterized protein SPBR_05864 [Sporothrix brasiliensis 5110]KIH93828.1 hypothetical protein SPBR_05864 [Sporothrix brasiliensis 5110]